MGIVNALDLVIITAVLSRDASRTQCTGSEAKVRLASIAKKTEI